MKTLYYNISYYCKETIRIIRMNIISNLFAILGTGLILFILGMVLTGWSISDRLVSKLNEEAEITVYISGDTKSSDINFILNEIVNTKGVWQAAFIDKEEAYRRMEDILGEESKVLGLFSENPLEPYIEVTIRLTHTEEVISKIKSIPGVDFIRDNKEVLDKIAGLTKIVRIASYFVFAAVSITSLIIISHMIRQGIYNNKEQIKTLRLLGAPSNFITTPFLLSGLLLNLTSGIIADCFLYIMIRKGYENLNRNIPFLPMPSQEELIHTICLILLGFSLILGFFGSLFGVITIIEKKKKVEFQ